MLTLVFYNRKACSVNRITLTEWMNIFTKEKSPPGLPRQPTTPTSFPQFASILSSVPLAKGERQCSSCSPLDIALEPLVCSPSFINYDPASPTTLFSSPLALCLLPKTSLSHSQ